MSDLKKSEPNSITSLNIFATIGAIVVGILSLKQNYSYTTLCYIATGIFFLYLLINYKRVTKFFTHIITKIKLFLNVVIEYRRGHLEFLDPYGKKAVYNEEIVFNRIKRGILYEGTIEVDGKIKNDVQTFNCYDSLNNGKNRISIFFGNKREKKDVINNKRQLQFAFAVTLENCFLKEKESWGAKMNHYTKLFDIKISFSKKNHPRNIDIFQITGLDENGKPILKLLPINPIVIRKYNRVIMKVKLLHLKKDDQFIIFWEWDKLKNKSLTS